jgi:hypothetical protein
VVAAYFLWFRGAGDALTYAPDSCVMVANVRWDDLRNSAAWKSMERENPDIQKSLNQPEVNGIVQKDVVQFVFMVGGTVGNDSKVGYVKTKQTVTVDDLKASAPKGSTLKESTVGSYKLYEGTTDGFCLLDSRTFLVGDNKTLRAVLTRNKKPTFTPEMDRAMADMNWSKVFSAAGTVKNWPGMSGGPAAPPGPPAMGGMPNYFENVEAVTLNVDVTADIAAHLVVQCKDPKSAEDLRKLADGGITSLKAMPGADSDTKDLLNAIKLANTGNKVTGDLTIRGDTIAKASKQQRVPGIPGF